MLAQIFDDLIADAVNRVQARHRLLKDHCHAVAHNGTTVFFRQRQQVHAVKSNAATVIRTVVPPNRPMIASDVRLLPQPLSPTIPKVSLSSTSKRDALDNWQKLASWH